MDQSVIYNKVSIIKTKMMDGTLQAKGTKLNDPEVTSVDSEFNIKNF